MKAYRQYESAQCLSEMFYLCVVHLYEFMCGNDSVECVRLKVQDWGHATVWKNWTSHINLPFAVFFFFCPLLALQSPHFVLSKFWGTCRPNHNQDLATGFDEHEHHNGQWHRVTHETTTWAPWRQPNFNWANEEVQYGTGGKQELELQTCKTAVSTWRTTTPT